MLLMMETGAAAEDDDDADGLDEGLDEGRLVDMDSAAAVVRR
jgi:hypothetical protein